MRLWILFFALFLSACGNLESRKTTYSGTKECVDDNCTSMFDVSVRKADRVINQRQLLPNIRKCLGLTANQVSNTTINAHAAAVPSLSKDGEVKEVSSAMLMAITKVSSEACMDLINLEKNNSQRSYFMGYNLGGTGDAAQSLNTERTLKKFAASCWGREITTSERQLLQEKISSNFQTATQGALLLCTTILSSTDAIRY